MPPFTLTRQSDTARVLVVSQRLRAPHISRCTLLEFEDLIGEFDSMDLVCPEGTLPTRAQRRWVRNSYRFLGWHGQLRRAPAIVDRLYDLVFFCCEDIADLIGIGPIAGWLASGRRRVCYIEELWAKDIPRRQHEIVLLRGFDHIFVSCAGAAGPLAEMTKVPVTYLAPSVDAVTFFPGVEPPSRSIDVYSMGRRSAVTHQAMLRIARDHGWFYVYDTHAGNRVIAPREHRLLLANLIKRSRYFVANRAKIDHAETRGQEEIGSRHFEGAAGGAVMIGEPPQCETYRTHFDWPDAVVPMAWNTDDPMEVIARLESDPDRLARVRANNLRYSLLRHDWVYRWEQVLNAIDLPPMPSLLRRKEQLASHAGLVDATLSATLAGR